MIQPVRIQFFTLLIRFLAVVFSSIACKKSDYPETALLTASEASEIVETAVAEPSAGVALASTETAKADSSSTQVCGSTHNTTLLTSKTTGLYSYNRQANLHWVIQCVNLIPQKAQFTLTGSGNFSTACWNGDNQTTGSNGNSQTWNGSLTLDGNGNATVVSTGISTPFPFKVCPPSFQILLKILPAQRHRRYFRLLNNNLEFVFIESAIN